MANDIRERVKEALKDVPPRGQEIASDGDKAQVFTMLTGWTHKQLTDKWDGGSKLTTCNEFVGKYTQRLRLPYLGVFALEDFLKQQGMSHAWVAASSGTRPKYGDVFKPKRYHMGISLDFEGDLWNTAESGQGGPKSHRDIIMRKQTPWDPSTLEGWVDIEVYSESKPQKGPAPDWIVGWWKVVWRGANFYYWFDKDRTVKWTPTAPANTASAPMTQRDTGRYAVTGANVIIRWGATGSIERFATDGSASPTSMSGTWNATETISATKM